MLSVFDNFVNNTIKICTVLLWNYVAILTFEYVLSLIMLAPEVKAVQI